MQKKGVTERFFFFPGLATYQWFLRLLGLLYLSLAVALFFFSNELVIQVNLLAQRYPMFDDAKLTQDYFWKAIVSAHYLTMFLLSLWSSFYPRIKGYFLIHFWSKIFGVLLFGTYLFYVSRSILFLVFGLLEAILAVLLLFSFVKSLVRKPTRLR
ncbi:MAG: hypothetical protein AB7F43_12025 [Bacteriovoracia bacterium]